MEPVLLVEDKAELREMLQQALARMKYDVVPAATATAARAAIRERRFTAVLTDLKLPDGSGLDVLRNAMEADGALPVVVMTAYGTIAEAVSAMRDGAYDFIQKPIDLEHLSHVLGRAIERYQLLHENVVLKHEYARRFGFPEMLGEHPSILTAGREMQRIAPMDSTVLLLGESGTGKELFARAIHKLSPRADKPFIALNCAAIPESLVENELFGHEKGAFTGADSRQAGRFELAHGGTLFLDEIGELPQSVQSKLLRVLEAGRVQRLGATSEVSVNVRMIAATNRDLEAAVEAQQFRRDLYYRLAVFPIRIPPLRERGDDVLLLAEHFLERFRRELRKPQLRLSAEAKKALSSHHWPGNVRELQNVIERVAILNDDTIEAAHLGLSQRDVKTRAAAAAANSAADRASLEAVMRDCKWNKQAAAERLGISYKTLLNRLKAMQLD
jgi:DNA-binding NtrC family response regulator